MTEDQQKLAQDAAIKLKELNEIDLLEQMLKDNVNELTPQKIANTSNWIHVSAGRSHSFAINSNYDLYGWGNFAATIPIKTYKYKSYVLGDRSTVGNSGVGAGLTTANTWHRWFCDGYSKEPIICYGKSKK